MSETTAIKLHDFVRMHQVKLNAKPSPTNPHMDGADSMDNWKCLLTCEGRRMTVYFSKGIGHHGAEPTADEVLDCLAGDASGLENARDFEDWCAEYGYDSDSRRAERTYLTIKRQRLALRRLLGDDAFDTLLWHTERE